MSLYELLYSGPFVPNRYEFKVEGEPGVTASLNYTDFGYQVEGELYYTEGDRSLFSIKSDLLKIVLSALESALLEQFPWTRPLLYPQLPKTALERILEEGELF